MTASKAIQKWRKRHGLTYDDIGRAAKVTKQAVYQWVKGDAGPDVETIKRLNMRWPGLTREMGLS